MLLASWVLCGGCGRVDFEEQAGEAPRDAGADGGSRTDTGPPASECRYQCTVTTTASTCTGAVLETTRDGDRSAFRIDMTGAERLRVRLEICNPVGWTFHLGDSPTNDGEGGDAGSAEHDAELQIKDRQFTVFDADGAPMDRRWDAPMVLPPTGCENYDVEIRPDEVRFELGDFQVNDPYLFAINPPADAEGTPDAIWYAGLNRTWSDGLRSGSGVQGALFCIEPLGL